jgi:hypothetical protein
MKTSVSLDSIESTISEKSFWNNGKTTVCILTLINGFEVIGTSGVVDKSKFNQELGEKFAYENAINKMWELEGYRLQWELFNK